MFGFNIGQSRTGYHRICMRIRPTAIIFDYGNVLCQPQPQASIEAMADILDLPVALFVEASWKHRLAFDEALLDPEAYWNTVAARSLTEAEIRKLTEIDNESWAHPDAVMPEWARQVRGAGFRTAILSNMPLTVREHLDRCNWLPEFDHRTFSCDLGIAKPSPAIYQHCLLGLGVAASDALFLDDRAENIRAAQALGIHSILFTNPEELAVELERNFDIPVPLIATVNRGDEKDH